MNSKENRLHQTNFECVCRLKLGFGYEWIQSISNENLTHPDRNTQFDTFDIIRNDNLFPLPIHFVGVAQCLCSFVCCVRHTVPTSNKSMWQMQRIWANLLAKAVWAITMTRPPPSRKKQPQTLKTSFDVGERMMITWEIDRIDIHVQESTFINRR